MHLSPELLKCIIIWNHQEAMTKYQRIQNMCTKLVLNKCKYDSPTECLKQLHWLPIEQWIQLKILVITHKWIVPDVIGTFSGPVRLVVFNVGPVLGQARVPASLKWLFEVVSFPLELEQLCELEQRVMAQCVKVLMTPNLAARLWYMSSCKYRSVWVGFLFTAVVRELPGCSITKVSNERNGPNSSCFFLCEIDVWVHAVYVFKECVLLWGFCGHKILSTYHFQTLGGCLGVFWSLSQSPPWRGCPLWGLMGDVDGKICWHRCKV